MLGLLESATRTGGAPFGSLTTAWAFKTCTPETRCSNRYKVAPPGRETAATGLSSLTGALAALSFAAAFGGAAEAEAGMESASTATASTAQRNAEGFPVASTSASASPLGPPSIKARVTTGAAHTSTTTGNTIGRRRSRS